MKKTILLAFLGAGLFTANAQAVNEGPASGDVTLNVNLYSLQSIVVNPLSNVVNLDYKTPADYLGGVNKDVVDHLKVFSTGAFDVKVKSNNTGPTLTGSGTSIPLADITILATQGTDGSNANQLTFNPTTAITLTNEAQIIGGSTKAGSGNISVNYKADGNNDYLSLVMAKAQTTYTANLVYSIIAK